MSSIPLKQFLDAHEENYIGSLERPQSMMFVELLTKAGAVSVLATDSGDERPENVQVVVEASTAVNVMCIISNFSPDHTTNLGKYMDTDHNVVEVWWD
jgi:hypothetical protein